MVDATALTRGNVPAGAVGATTNVDTDIMCVGDDNLIVQLDANGAANGDWTVQVTPYESDNTTPSGVDIPAASSAGPTFAGGKVTFFGRFDVRGVEKVRLRIRNTTAGALNLNRASWRLA
jgi:hypothetical protein